MRRRDALHALERFQATLRLASLARFGTEALDKGLHVLDLALLAREERRLLGEFRRALIFEGGVVAALRVGHAVRWIDDAIDDATEKFAIVRDQQQGARMLTQ